MSYNNDYRRSRRADRTSPSRQPPYPNDGYSMPDDHRSRFPPPPMGDALNDKPRSAMKKSTDRSSRVPTHVRPEFPDEGSYLGSAAPDLERKNKPHHQKFRDMRDGYESEEGEQLRRDRPYDDGDRRRPPRDGRSYPDDPRDRPARSRRDPYDGPEPRSRRQHPQSYDQDDYSPPRPRRHRPDVEYGSEPIPMHRSNSERASRRRRDDRQPEYDDSYRPRRRRSEEDRRRDNDEAPRHRDRERRRYSVDEGDEYHSRRDRDRDRDRRHHGRDNRNEPSEFKVGNYDLGSVLQKGQKHYAALAPIVTPIVMNMAKKYFSK